MNKLAVQHPALTYSVDTQSGFSALQPAEEILWVDTEVKPASRLMILIPADVDYALVMKRVWELAMATGMHIQFISLCRDLSEEPRLRRELVTMSALIRDGRVCVEAKVEIGTSWVDVVKNNYQPGDMIVCFAEQNIGLFHRPLSQILQANMKAPIYILSGLAPQNSSGSS